MAIVMVTGTVTVTLKVTLKVTVMVMLRVMVMGIFTVMRRARRSRLLRRTSGV
jgi:hypothetical protein